MQIKRLIVFAAIIGLLNSCGGKSSSSPTSPTQETQVAFTMDASGTIQTPGTSYTVNTTLTSSMPSTKGISIVATVTDQTNNNTISQNAAITSTSTTNAVTIINLPSQHLCTVTIKISSVATPSNNASLSFNLANKQ